LAGVLSSSITFQKTLSHFPAITHLHLERINVYERPGSVSHSAKLPHIFPEVIKLDLGVADTAFWTYGLECPRLKHLRYDGRPSPKLLTFIRTHPTITTLELLDGVDNSTLHAIAVEALLVEHLVLPAHYLFDCLISSKHSKEIKKRTGTSTPRLFHLLSSLTILKRDGLGSNARPDLGKRLDTLIRSRYKGSQSPQILRFQEGLDLKDCRELKGVPYSSVGSSYGLLREYIFQFSGS
jgi:hypothetical protein